MERARSNVRTPTQRRTTLVLAMETMKAGSRGRMIAESARKPKQKHTLRHGLRVTHIIMAKQWHLDDWLIHLHTLRELHRRSALSISSSLWLPHLHFPTTSPS